MVTLQLSAVIGSSNYQNYQNYQTFRHRYSCFPRRLELGRASCLTASGTLVSPDVLNLDEPLLSLLRLSALGTLVSLDVLNLDELLPSLLSDSALGTLRTGTGGA